MINYFLDSFLTYSFISLVTLFLLFILVMGIDAFIISTILGGLFILSYI